MASAHGGGSRPEGISLRRGYAAADEEGLAGDEIAMVLVADAPGSAEPQYAFVDTATEAVATTSATIGVVVVAAAGPGMATGMISFLNAYSWLTVIYSAEMRDVL
jgi:hypothetical protein